MEEPPPPPTPNLTTPIKKSWKVSEKPTKDPNIFSLLDNWNFNPLINSISIASVDWDQAIGVKCSTEGSEGAFFVEIRDSGALVIKGSTTVAADLFTSLLASKLGLSVPSFRVCSYLDSKEWDTMVGRLWQLEATNSNEGRGSKLSKCLLRPFIIVMEYIKGLSLDTISIDMAHDTFQDPEILQQLGKIIAFDILINNWDRLPCIWKNDGNPKNILFSTSSKTVYGIDTTITSIDPALYPDNLNQYHKLILDLLQALRSETVESSQAKRIRSFISDFSGYDIKEEGSISIQHGIVQLVREIVQLKYDDLKEIKEQVEGQLKSTMELLGLTPDTVGLSRINLDYLDRTIRIIKDNLY